MQSTKDDEIIDSAETTDAFRIDSESAANWVLGKLAAIDEEAARIKAQAQKRQDELKADRERLLGRFGAELEAWAREERERRKRKTITLLNGTLAFRTTPRRFTVSDTETAMTTARAVCPDAVVTVEKLDTDAFKEYALRQLEETGEILPGVEITPEGESFSVRTPKPGKENEQE